MDKIFYTPGPSALFHTVEQHIKDAIRKNILSISHRGKEYVKIQEETTEGLRSLLNIPQDCTIGFTSSATEVWERISENLIDKKSLHLVNGYFSKKFHSAAISIGKDAIALEMEGGTHHDVVSLEVSSDVELIGLAQNETSTGAALPVEDIELLKDKYPDPLLMVDAVSSLPIPNFNFDKLDSLYFSVQKSFGLPAGLGVWMFNNRCIEKAAQLKNSGKYHDSYNSILNISKFAKKHQTTCTPNVLNIYLLGQVVKDMLNKGINQIRQESSYKSALLYNLFETHPKLTPFVQEKRFRSITVGVAKVEVGSEKLLSALSQKGLEVGNGYGSYKNEQIRIANFPTHSKEQIEMLVDVVNELEF